jgi:hypothetical protein
MFLISLYPTRARLQRVWNVTVDRKNEEIADPNEVVRILRLWHVSIKNLRWR